MFSIARVLGAAVHAAGSRGRPAKSDDRSHRGREGPAVNGGLAGAVYYRCLRMLGLPAATRRLQTSGLILCYHNVVPNGYAEIGCAGVHMSRDTFERQMRWLTARYTVVSLTEFVDRLERGASLRAIAAVAFDDGYNGVFEQAAPILHALGIGATVFVVAEAVGRSEGFWWDQPAIVSQATEAQREMWLTDLRGDDD